VGLDDVWRFGGKLIELFCAMSCTTVVHNDTHTKFLNLLVSFGLDWLGRTYLKLPVLCRLGCKTLTQSISQHGDVSGSCSNGCSGVK